MNYAIFYISGFLSCFALAMGYGFHRLSQKAAPAPEPLEKHPCEVRHELISIDVRPSKCADGSAATILLSRCSKCEVRMATVYPGQWTIGDFLKEKSELADLEGMLRK